jgi:hypothetical protein
MSAMNSNWFETFLNVPFISRIRRNHGLEHACLNILAGRKPRRNMAGHSDMKGFWLLGDIPTEEVQSAVQEALKRMRAGEHHLAVHPNCGTNLVTAGTLAGLAGVAGMWGAGRRWRDKLDRLPLVATLATLALVAAQPLGFLLQRELTTSGDPGNLEVVEIIPTQRGRVKAHRVLTRG